MIFELVSRYQQSQVCKRCPFQQNRKVNFDRFAVRIDMQRGNVFDLVI